MELPDQLTAQDIRTLLGYDPETGHLSWKIARRARGGRIRPGSIAGFIDPNGYIQIRIGSRLHMAHRIAWLHYYGEWPVGLIDHVDLNKHNNAISNLRIASPSQNNMNAPLRKNNTSGTKGVTWDRGRWKVSIGVDGQHKHIGRFLRLDDAIAARRKAEADYHLSFARVN